MYTPYLICGYVATLSFVLIGFRVIHRTSPDLRGQKHLSRFLLSVIASLLLFSARGRLPLFLTAVVPNFLIFAGAVSVYLGATEILQVPPRFLSWQVNLCATALPPSLWFTYVHPSVLARLLIHTVVLGAISAFTAAMLFRQQAPAFRSSLRAAAWLLAFVVIVQALWTAAAILHPPSSDFLHIGIVDTAFSYVSLLLGVANVAALMWLSLCIHRGDLHRMAQTDALTGLLNRRAFEEILCRELPRADGNGHRLGMLLVDLDHFKRINDSLGHHAGDEALRRIADVLRQVTRVSDVLARYGGEEFVILLRDAGLQESAVIAERVRIEIAGLRGLPGDIRLTGSIGAAIGHGDESPSALLLRADEALYRAKRAGRNLVSIDREPFVIH